MRHWMRRRHQGLARMKPHEAESYLVAAMKEIDRLRARLDDSNEPITVEELWASLDEET